MNRTTIGFLLATASLLASACSLASPRAGGTPPRQVQITEQTLASQPSGQPLVLDLTDDGTVYDVASKVDARRVQVRMADRNMQLSEIIERWNMQPGRLLLGTLTDMSSGPFALPDYDVSRPPGTSPVQCTPGPDAQACWCIGKRDCSDMGRSRICYEKTTICGVGSDNHWGCTCWKSGTL